MELIRAGKLREMMETTILPYVKTHKESGFFERTKGRKIYYEHIPAPEEKADLVLVHGFTEWIPKFYETVWYFNQLGYGVWLLEQEGHGFSFRQVEDPSLVYIEDYREMVEDLHYFTKSIVRGGKAPERAQVLYGHSMGGGISALLLEAYPEDYNRAILNSPMLEINNGGIPVGAAKLVAGLLKKLGKGKSYLPGGGPFNAEADFENSCTNCRERFDFDLERQIHEVKYHTCAPAVQTAGEFLKITEQAVKEENVKKITARVLLLQAEKDTVVKPGGQDLFMERLGAKGKKVVVKNAKHEIYRCDDEILTFYWNEIKRFLNETE